MGTLSSLTKEQKILLDEVKRHKIFEDFYFTGGTALSWAYLNHRYSEDIDFFTQNTFDNQVVFTIIEGWSRKHNFTFQSNFVEVVYIFNLTFKNKKMLKLDFATFGWYFGR